MTLFWVQPVHRGPWIRRRARMRLLLTYKDKHIDILHLSYYITFIEYREICYSYIWARIIMRTIWKTLLWSYIITLSRIIHVSFYCKIYAMMILKGVLILHSKSSVLLYFDWWFTTHVSIPITFQMYDRCRIKLFTTAHFYTVNNYRLIHNAWFIQFVKKYYWCVLALSSSIFQIVLTWSLD